MILISPRMKRNPKDEINRLRSEDIFIDTISRHRKDGKRIGYLVQVHKINYLGKFSSEIVFRTDYFYREVIERLYITLTKMNLIKFNRSD